MNNIHDLTSWTNAWTQGPEWLKKQAQQAIEDFSLKGFPTPKHEDWKYTPLRRLLEQSWKKTEAVLTIKASSKVIALDFISALQQYPEEVEKYFANFCKIYSQQDAFYDLNTALFHQGFVIIVPENTFIDEPIEITYPHLAAEQMGCWRNLIIIKENSSASIIERFESSDSHASFHQVITEVYVHSHGQLQHYKKQCESMSNFHISELFVKQQDHSRVESHVLSLQGGFIRSDTHIRLEAPHAECLLNGVTLGQKKQLIDHHTTVEHLTPNGTSDEYYKGILKEEAQGVFNGKVIVSPHAIQTNAAQNNKTLLLSRAAQMNSKPQLEIFSDDVKCTHGSTVGQLDEEALFYLETRGIPKSEAQQLLMEAFLSDVLDRIPNEALKKEVQQYLEKSL
jgi:Fe-S cluster assembly protein SufD